MTVSTEEFKRAMGRWATGVTIVTSCRGDDIHGMTVSDFAGVSADPPLVLVCADKTANTQAMIAASRVFAVNFLADGQQALSNRFASKEDEWRRFEGLSCETAVTGAPLLPGALVSLDCRVVASHDAGDHVIYVGSLEAVVQREGEPLVYWSGGYRRLADGS